MYLTVERLIFVILILVSIFILCRIYRKTSGTVERYEALSNTAIAIIALWALGVSILAYLDNEKTEQTKATVDAKRRLLLSIDENSRAATELIKKL